MDLISRLSDGYGQLFMFSGRATRAQFWTLYAANFGVFLASLMLAAMMPESLGTPLVIFGLVMVTVGNLAAAIRRLHDTNRTGWWICGVLVPVVQLVIVYFLIQPSVSGPTRYDAHSRSTAPLASEPVETPKMKRALGS